MPSSRSPRPVSAALRRRADVGHRDGVKTSPDRSDGLCLPCASRRPGRHVRLSDVVIVRRRAGTNGEPTSPVCACSMPAVRRQRAGARAPPPWFGPPSLKTARGPPPRRQRRSPASNLEVHTAALPILVCRGFVAERRGAREVASSERSGRTVPTQRVRPQRQRRTGCRCGQLVADQRGRAASPTRADHRRHGAPAAVDRRPSHGESSLPS